MKIGIIGSGDVGQSLGKGFIKSGYEVMIGSREPDSEKLLAWKNETKTGQTGTFEASANFGEIIVIAIKWDGVENALNLAGKDKFKNKIVIDVTNPLDFSMGMPPQLAVGNTNSAGEIIQAWLPESRVVKTLNIITHTNMYMPKFVEGKPEMFLCGDNPESKEKVKEILKQFGWERITDLGDIKGARLMEPLCILWVTYGMLNNTWSHGFAVLRS